MNSTNSEAKYEKRYLRQNGIWIPKPNHYRNKDPLVETAHNKLYLTTYIDSGGRTRECVAKIPKGMAGMKVCKREFEFTKKFNHPNVLTPIAFYSDVDISVMFYPYCAGGTVADLLKNPMKLNERICRAVFKQMVRGLRYTHRRRVIHNDVKPDNFFIDGSTIKLADFGLSKPLSTREMDDDYVGTPLFMAPEVLMKASHNHSADVWSLGITLFYMFYETYPFEGKSVRELQNAQLHSRLAFPSRYSSDELKDLLRKILVIRSSDRLTLDEILEHPWFFATALSARDEPKGRGYHHRQYHSSPPVL